ncbi:hypothetical protein [Oceanicaulis sp.]|uniref:hypothetical protein n=1 Tax=Oceanicaulis sp. TaxID=1924941 RepID=UPI003D2B7E80
MALHSDGGPGSGPGIQVEVEGDSDAAEITPAQWAAMARGLKQRALRLTEAGRLRQAEQALRLAERYERMQSCAAPAPEAAEEDGARYYDELDARLDRLAAHLRQQAGLKPDAEFSPAHRAALGLPPRPEDGAGEAGHDCQTGRGRR